jgi:hypothetical protein
MSRRIFQGFGILGLMLALAVAGTPLSASPAFIVKNHRLILSNGYVCVEFDEAHPGIDVVKADFFGQGHYGGNLLATNSIPHAGIALETIDTDGLVHNSWAAPSRIRYHVLRNDAAGLSVQIEGIQDRKWHPIATSTWTLTLLANSRKFTLATRTKISHSHPVKAVEISACLDQWFMNGCFQRGVMQYVNCGDQSFFTTNQLETFYTMDNRNGSVAIVLNHALAPNLWAMRSCESNRGVALEAILAGNYPVMEQWQSAHWQSARDVTPAKGTMFETSFDVYPNDYSFPVATIPVNDPMASRDFRDLRTIYIAIYGSAAGVLGSFKHDGSAYPTLATPKWPYGNLFTFFDPDSWSTVNTLSFSGDPYLQDQARRIVELAGSHIKDGQVPHHFIDGTPTYIAISQATQTGPNMFWVMAAIDYATATGNETWLRDHYPQLKAATDWVLDCYDPSRKLVKVGGPLFIDVFIRRGYTLDSNAMLLRLLPEMAAVADFCGDAASAGRYRDLAEAIKQGLNDGLWDGHDHYVTQRNPDWSIRDMVDYDGNYAAIAFGATTNRVQIAAMYHRLDGGPDTHPGNRGTWVSEKYYGPADCFGGNTGDSATAMARIWWLDLESRYVTGDVTNFYRYFERVQNDLLQRTWLTERYNAKGNSIRVPYYHEYPEITDMVLREMVYGIDVKIDRVRIRPFGLANYHYQVGDLDVSYSPKWVSLHIPGHDERTYEIAGLLPKTPYLISTGRKIVTGADGTATFQAPVGETITLQIAR